MAENIPAWKRVQSINRTVTLPTELREFFSSLANSTRRLLEAIDSPVADPQTPYGEQRVASLMLNTLAVMEHFGLDGLQGTGRTVRESIEAGEPDGVVIGELLPAALAIKSACDELRAHWKFDGHQPASGDYTKKRYRWGDPVPTGTRDKLAYGARTIEAILAEPAESGDGQPDKAITADAIDDKAEANGRIPPAPQYVTLSQMSAIVSRSKRTLERAKTSGSLPTPDIEGGGGHPDEWRWDRIRPWLEENYRRGLPEKFPA